MTRPMLRPMARPTAGGLAATLLAAAAVAVAAAPGAGAAGTAPRTVPIRVTVSSPTHRPRVGEAWPVRVTVTDLHGRPVAAKLTMRVLFGGVQVGKIDDGAVYRFVGTWQERKGNEITWPAAARGQPLVFQVVVTAKGVTVRKNWTITVR